MEWWTAVSRDLDFWLGFGLGSMLGAILAFTYTLWMVEARHD